MKENIKENIKEKFSLKDHLFNEQKVRLLAEEIFSVHKDFQKEKFIIEALKEFKNLELKERITHLTKLLKKYLPENFRDAADIILKSLPKELDNKKSDNDFGDFIYSPYGEFIATYGLNKKDLNFSLNALKEITKRFSCEYPIRVFLNNFEKETFDFLLKASKDKNYHVRRLASEGTRAKLPWAPKINLNYKESLKILNNLYLDSTRYVVRSVANHLHDISKIDSDLVLKTLKSWEKELNETLKNNKKINFKEKEKEKLKSEFEYLKWHSLRTLIKNGDKNTLKYLGYKNEINIELKNFNLKNNKVKIGEALSFSFEIINKNNKTENLIIDYIIYFAKKESKKEIRKENMRESKKVFKLKELKINKEEKVLINKKHPFRIMTTRKLYTGEHKIIIQINGKNYLEKSFDLYE